MKNTICPTIDYSVIPNWTDDSLLPYAFEGSNETTSKYTSPYMCNMHMFYSRFCYTEDRLQLIEGFLKYRKYLFENVYTILPEVQGIQWIGGSFCEDSESSRKSPPHDIDVLTSLMYPGVLSEDQREALHLSINTFEKKQFFKETLKIDSYYNLFDSSTAFFENTMKTTAFWVGLWSHTRSPGKRKGFIQLSMDPLDDKDLFRRL
ncbi:MAG: hypothetical protein RBR15_05845 [Sphaerochaeta sp.]|nr:hypothetical protein [Sphaerochaeta sp.]